MPFIPGWPYSGVSRVITPPHADIACAVGAASAHVGASAELVLPADEQLQGAIDDLCEKVCAPSQRRRNSLRQVDKVALSYG
ncbi:hypothetical protein [Streptacidiphilus sp. PAMC 29251]